jgi:hypothetical protein
MTKNKFLSVGLFCIGLAACASQKNGVKKGKDANTKTPIITELSLNRTVCYGRCPDYTLEIFANGKVIYTGRRFAEPQGTWEKMMGEAKVKGILAQAAAYRIDTCQESYRVNISDVPAVNYTYTVDGAERKIANANFGPSFLTTLAEQIDKAIGKPDAGWKKTAEWDDKN